MIIYEAKNLKLTLSKMR